MSDLTLDAAAGLLFFLLSIVGIAYCLSRAIKIMIGIIRVHCIDGTSIGALPSSGQVKVIGKAEKQAIYSPIAQKSCVWWRIEVQKEQGDEYGSAWTTFHKETSMEPLEINDGTGKIKIFPEPSTNFIIYENPKREIFLNESSNVGVIYFLEKAGVKPTNFLGIKRKLQVVETIIEAGENFYIWGEVQHRNAIKMIVSKPSLPLIISIPNGKQLLRLLYFYCFLWFTGIVVIVLTMIMMGGWATFFPTAGYLFSNI